MPEKEIELTDYERGYLKALEDYAYGDGVGRLVVGGSSIFLSEAKEEVFELARRRARLEIKSLNTRNEAGQSETKPRTFYCHVNSGNSVFVKEKDFFESQGGLVSPWGKAWFPVTAVSIEDALRKGRCTPASDRKLRND